VRTQLYFSNDPLQNVSSLAKFRRSHGPGQADETDTSAQVAMMADAAEHPSTSDSMQHCNAKRAVANTTSRSGNHLKATCKQAPKDSPTGICAVKRQYRCEQADTVARQPSSGHNHAAYVHLHNVFIYIYHMFIRTQQTTAGMRTTWRPRMHYHGLSDGMQPPSLGSMF
jgi:hypothetical protein